MADASDRLLRRHVAANLRERRRVLHLSQEAVALESGFHRTFIGHVERAETNISIDNLERLAKALRVPAHDLLKPRQGAWRMRGEILKLYEVAQRVDDIASVDQLTAEVAGATAQLGVTAVSVNLIVTPGKVLRPGILLGRRWRQWSERYAREGFSQADPAVRMLRAQTRPFTWSEAVERYGSAAARRVMEACRETTGAREGFVVPIRETDGALLSAAFCGEALDLDPEARAALHLVGYYYATRGRELVQNVGLKASCPLTPRQIESLRWVLVGKTDSEISRILNLSANTVHKHVESAKKVMGVAKRGQAAHEAWRYGWLD